MRPRAAEPRQTVVIGLGNPLMADDGVGIAALERLRGEWTIPSEVELVDGGTWGLNLLPIIEDAGRLLLIDAIDRGAPPGTAIRLDRREIPRHLTLKMSPHQIDLREVLALAELRGTFPEQTLALGLQPERIELFEGMSPSVERGLDVLVGRAVDALRAWGHRCLPKPSRARA